MLVSSGSAALAAVGKSETTQGHAVLWAKGGHGRLQKLNWDYLKAGKDAGATKRKSLAVGEA
jgi:hypothetical protein